MPKISATKKRIANWLIRDKYAGNQSSDLSADLVRLKKGEPLDYIIGWSDFCDCRIGLESRPLIPRAETEYWTEQVIKEITNRSTKSTRNTIPPPGGIVLRQKIVQCLDIFAGSGCIGIAVLKHCPGVTVDFLEKDKKLGAQIKKNCARNGIDPKRYQIIHSDLFKSLGGPTAKWKYDYILANPPYIPLAREKRLAKSVTNWEPALALYAGDKGLAVIEKFLRGAKNHLLPGGRIWLEFDAGQKPTLVKMLSVTGYKNIEFQRDQYKRWRWVTASIDS